MQPIIQYVIVVVKSRSIYRIKDKEIRKDEEIGQAVLSLQFRLFLSNL